MFGRYVPTLVRYWRLLTPLQILVVTVGLTSADPQQQPNTAHAAFCFPTPPSLDVRSLPLPRMEFDGRKRNLQTHNDCTSLSRLLQPALTPFASQYTYLTCIPLLAVYAVGFCYIKYSEGYIALPLTGMVIPKPVDMWSQAHQDYVFPLQLCFSFAWSLEIVTHLEELCFWLFLIHTTDASPWFRSTHFIAWAIGSCIALAGLPSVTIYLKDDIELVSTLWMKLSCSAYT